MFQRNPAAFSGRGAFISFTDSAFGTRGEYDAALDMLAGEILYKAQDKAIERYITQEAFFSLAALVAEAFGFTDDGSMRDRLAEILKSRGVHVIATNPDERLERVDDYGTLDARYNAAIEKMYPPDALSTVDAGGERRFTAYRGKG